MAQKFCKINKDTDIILAMFAECPHTRACIETVYNIFVQSYSLNALTRGKKQRKDDTFQLPGTNALTRVHV